MDVLTRKQRSYCMSQIRGKNTKPEITLRKELWSLGLRYRIYHKLPGKPDIVFVSRKVIVFVDGCFWHGCPVHGVKPKTNVEFWSKKIRGNVIRDKKNQQVLENLGWQVLRFWEHEIKQSVLEVSMKILDVVKTKVSLNEF